MRRPLAYSVVLHGLIIAIVAFGLPALSPAPPVIEEPMVVDLLPLADRSNPPPTTERAPAVELAKPAPPRPTRDEPSRPAEPKVASRSEPAPARPPRPELPQPEPPKPEPKAEPKPDRPEQKPRPPQPPKPDIARAEPKPEPPKPEPPKPEPKAARAEREPEAKPQPKPREAAPQAKPDSKAEPRPEPKAESKPDKPEPKPQPAAPKSEVAKGEPKPEPPKPASPSTSAPRKPEPAADDFASVMKAVGDLKQSGKASAKPSPSTTGKAEKPGDGDLSAQVAQALRSVGPTGNKESLPVTASEIDAVRRQIERCWNLPAGAKDAGDLVVSIRVEMNPDGTPRTAAVDGNSRGQGNPLFQATADSARRAVLNPRCHPFKLPPDKYDRWRTMTLIFNPRQMS